jgi:DUF4097 and DUF4098 domain-containing protein YvlB
MNRAGTTSLILIAVTVAAAITGCRPTEFTNFSSNAEQGTGSDSGAVNISQMGGGIDVKDAPHGADLSTMGGDIHLGSVASFAKVKTMGGNVSIDQATGSIDASTMGGEITIGEANGAIKASTMGGNIQARMVGTSSGRRDVELTSMGGTITLTVPKGFPMDVRITLAYTKSAHRTFQIIESADLEQRETPDWDFSKGTPRKYIRAQGRVGNGLNHVVINTVNGDVILKQE